MQNIDHLNLNEVRKIISYFILKSANLDIITVNILRNSIGFY